jgi:CBS domain-containing protein
MLEAKDIMTKNVVCIKKNIPVVDAIRLMSKNNITGIPVVEDDMTLVGILSEQYVLRLFHTYEDEKDRTVNPDICPTGALLLACFTLIGASHQLRRFIAL